MVEIWKTKNFEGTGGNIPANISLKILLSSQERKRDLEEKLIKLKNNKQQQKKLSI